MWTAHSRLTVSRSRRYAAVVCGLSLRGLRATKKPATASLREVSGGAGDGSAVTHASIAGGYDKVRERAIRACLRSLTG